MADAVRIFLSSTWLDLQPERAAVEAALRRMFDAAYAGMEHFGSRPETPREASLEEVDHCDIYVGLFGYRYGSGITEAEYRRARERGLPCLIYFKREPASESCGERESDPEAAQRLRALKEELAARHIVSFFDDPPSLATQVVADLHNQLVKLRPALDPPDASGSARDNLPSELDTFIGREAELRRIRGLLARARLVTLIGAGGAGKSRLAIHTARQLLQDFRDGVWLVELAALEEPSFLPQVVASALRLREVSGQPPIVTLTDHLRAKQLLLVLDNCEHLIVASSLLVRRLLSDCPELRALVASRTILGVPGEAVYRVPSLSLPTPPPPPPSPDQLSHFEATRLFIDRATTGNAAFTVTGDNAPALAQICLRLDGIPLAIELAAARVRSLSVEQIEARLGDRFRFLADRNAPLPRHQTLRATLDWSHDLLREPERVLFRRLGVFAGGLTLAAAEEVCADPILPRDDVLDLLTQLINQSLLTASEHLGEACYDALETIRTYALERLEASGELAEMRLRHAEYYLRLAEDAEPRLATPEQATVLKRLAGEVDNFRAALSWSQTPIGQPMLGLTLAAALGRFWHIRGLFSEGRRHLEAALAAADESTPPLSRAKALHRAGVLAAQQNDGPAAQALLEESLALRREHGDRAGAAACLADLGLLAWEQVNLAAARSWLEQSLRVACELADARAMGYAHDLLGMVLADLGELAEARTHVRASLDLAEGLGDQNGIAWSYHDLGMIALAEQDGSSAETHLRAALDLARTLGNRQLVGYALGSRGLLAAEQARYDAGHALLRESLGAFREVGDWGGVALAIEGLAVLEAVAGRASLALRLAGAAAAIRSRVGRPRSPLLDARYESHFKMGRQALDERVAATAWAEGTAMSTEQAIALALERPAV